MPSTDRSGKIEDELMLKPRNQYRVLEGDHLLVIPNEIGGPLGFGRDYYLGIFRTIESNGIVTGLTFYLSKEKPAALPTYGRDVLLVVVGDEHYACLAYFRNLLAIIRCYGSWPRYFDGFPTDLLRLSALFLFLLKSSEHLSSLLATARFRRAQVRDIHRRTLHLPLGSFGVFDPKIVEFSARSIDYAFLASIDHRQHAWYSLRKLMKPPKFIARNKMVDAVSAAKKSLERWRGRLDVSCGYEDSISNEESYILAMGNCKISLCLRGSNQETHRACVVNWRELPSILDRLLSNPEELERLSGGVAPFGHLCWRRRSWQRK